MTERPRRPALLGPAALEAAAGGDDPGDRTRAAHHTASVLVGHVRSARDERHRELIANLAEDGGIELLADLWSDSPADSLPGALWRLYVLRTWVHQDPVGAAREFAAGRTAAPVLEVLAGVGDPPGPDQVAQMVDAVLVGVASGDFAVTLERAAAFARIAATGRSELAGGDPDGVRSSRIRSAKRLIGTAEHLERAAALWRLGQLV